MPPRHLLPLLATGLALAPPGAAGAAEWSSPQTVLGPAPLATVPLTGGVPAFAGSSGLLAAGGARAVVLAAGADGRFGAPETISGAASGSVVLATDGAGTQYAAWTDTASKEGRLAVRPAGGAFGAPESLGPVSGLDLAVAPSGEAVVVWRVRDASGYRILAARRPAGGGLGSPQTLVTSTGGVDQPRAAIAPNGTAVAAWRRLAPRYRVETAFAPAGQPFGGTTMASPQIDGQALDVTLAFTGAGTPLVGWSTAPATGAWVATVGPSGAGAPVPVTAAGDPGTGFTLATDPRGGAVAAWDAGDRIRAARADGAGAFGPAADAIPSSGAAIMPPAAAVAADGTLLVLAGDPGSGQVRVAAQPAGGAFGAPEQLGWLGQSGGGVRLAAGPGERAVATWTQQSDTDVAVLASMRSEAITQAPNPGTRPTKDTTAPKLRLTLPKGRKVKLGRHTTLRLTGTVDEGAHIDVTGRALASGKLAGPLRAASLTVGRPGPVTLKVRYGARTLNAIRRALRRHRTVTVSLAVDTRDAGGNGGRQRVKLRLVR